MDIWCGIGYSMIHRQRLVYFCILPFYCYQLFLAEIGPYWVLFRLHLVLVCIPFIVIIHGGPCGAGLLMLLYYLYVARLYGPPTLNKHDRVATVFIT